MKLVMMEEQFTMYIKQIQHCKCRNIGIEKFSAILPENRVGIGKHLFGICGMDGHYLRSHNINIGGS